MSDSLSARRALPLLFVTPFSVGATVFLFGGVGGGTALLAGLGAVVVQFVFYGCWWSWREQLRREAGS